MAATTTDGVMAAAFLKEKWEAGKPYDEYVASGTDAQQAAWREVYESVQLTDDQRRLIEGFQRVTPVLVSSGVWCGDCVHQCPLLERIAEANPEMVRLRFVDRDEHADLAGQVKICGGMRVPVAIFMAEDFEAVSVFGDRTLTRYRALAAQALGASCPVPGAPVPPAEREAVLQEWLDVCERAQTLCRLSPRLRQKHGD